MTKGPNDKLGDAIMEAALADSEDHPDLRGGDGWVISDWVCVAVLSSMNDDQGGWTVSSFLHRENQPDYVSIGLLRKAEHRYTAYTLQDDE